MKRKKKSTKTKRSSLYSGTKEENEQERKRIAVRHNLKFERAALEKFRGYVRETKSLIKELEEELASIR